MKNLLDELWEKSNLTYISDLKGKCSDVHIQETLKQIPIEPHNLKEWKEVLSYIGADVRGLDSVEHIKNYIEKL